MSQHRTVNLALIFPENDDLADFIADQAEQLYSEFLADGGDPYEPDDDPPAAKVVPLWAGLLAAADGRRGCDSREGRRLRRERTFRRTAA